MQLRTHTWGNRFLIVMTAFFILFILPPTWKAIADLFPSKATLLFALGLVLFLLIGIVVISDWKIRGRTFLLVLFAISFFVRLGWIWLIPTEPFSDFKLMYESAVQAAQGDFSFQEYDYYSQWVYQLGFTMYQALVIKLFGSGLMILKILNALYQTGIALLLYMTARHLFGEFSGRVAGLIYAFYPSSIMMSSVLTNQHLADFLFYAGFALLISKGFESRYAWIGVGALIALGDIIRPYGPVVLLAILFFSILQLFIKKNEKRIHLIGRMVGVLLLFYGLHWVVSSLFISGGVTSYPLGSRDPYWKFVEGLNSKSIGQYYPPDDKLLYKLPLEEKKEKEKQMIKERLSNREELMELFPKKVEFLWGSPDQASWWSLTKQSTRNQSYPRIERWETRIERLLFFALSLLSLIALFRLWGKGGERKESLFLLLILGYAAVHVLIEIQIRYRYFLIPSFVLFAGFGLDTLLYWGRLLFARWKVKSR